MTRYLRDIRLIPIVLVATISLFALKFSGLVFDGGYTLGDRLANRGKPELKVIDPNSIPETPSIVVAGARPAGMDNAKRSWAQEMFNYPDGSGDITGSVGGDKKDDKAKAEEPKPAQAKKPENPPKDPGGTVISTEPPRMASAGERAVLERLQDRRQEIEKRARELEMRESLLKQAEQRIEAKLLELKNLETKLNEGSAGEKSDKARFKSLVSMYENMKPKDAARIFDRLDIKILIEVTTLINPRKMSEILGNMAPQAAEKLTVELARRAAENDPAKANKMLDLPKIEGQPSDTRPPRLSQKAN